MSDKFRKHWKPKETWNNTFHCMSSKDNSFYPRSLREYFDTPMEYNISGIRQYFIYKL